MGLLGSCGFLECSHSAAAGGVVIDVVLAVQWPYVYTVHRLLSQCAISTMAHMLKIHWLIVRGIIWSSYINSSN